MKNEKTLIKKILIRSIPEDAQLQEVFAHVLSTLIELSCEFILSTTNDEKSRNKMAEMVGNELIRTIKEYKDEVSR